MTHHDRTTVSAVLIVKDEEDVLARCLESVAWADQVVVYDTGSRDGTLAIARELADTVVEGYWDDDFGAARNRAMTHATGSWILVIDADEAFVGDPANVRTHLASGRASLWTVPIENESDGTVRVGGASVSVRVFARGEYRYEGALHEQVVPARPGLNVRVQALPNAVLRHWGYTTGMVERRGKRERNLALSAAELERGGEAGIDPVRLDILRANHARSLLMAGRLEEGLELGAVVQAAGRAPAGTMVQLAASCVNAALTLDDMAAVERWLTVWGEQDYSPVWALEAEVRLRALQDRPADVLELLDRLPTTTVDRAGRRFIKHQLADVAVWALAAEGRLADALRVADDAACAGYASATPRDLVRIHVRRGRPIEEFLKELTGTSWREYALRCVREPSPEAYHFLSRMADVRPGDTAVLLCAAALAPALGLEDLAVWAASIRRVGLGEHCPLVTVSRDSEQEPKHRALAAAMAYGIYGDERALPGLQAALAEVPAAEEAELLTQLDVVAPGLVTPATA